MDPNHPFIPNSFAPVPEVQPPTRKSHKLIIVFTILILLILTGSVFAYMYVKELGLFSHPSYSENTFLSSLLEKVSAIDSLSYAFSASLEVVPRDADAKPFAVAVSNTPELRKHYQADAERARDVSSLLYALQPVSKTNSYPTSLKALVAARASQKYASPVSITDPITKREYEYAVTPDGKDFRLSVNFETADALREIKDGYRYTATSTLVNGMKATFTKDSSPFYSLSQEPPKPFFVEMQDSARMLPVDMDASLTVSGATDLQSEVSDWLFNVDAEGDFGDLTYKINADALKKAEDYFFRINNLPSIFMSFVPFKKGQWVKVSPKQTATSSSMIDRYSFVEYEKTYKDNRQKLADLSKKLIALADSERLIRFKKPPRREKVDGRTLTRYELSIRKEALLPFYTKAVQLLDSDEFLKDLDIRVDEGMIEYLQSSEFNQVFDYFDKNTQLVLWIDAEGFPAISEMTIRVVPPDTATQLADKQANIIFKIIYKDINKPLTIKAPTGAVDLEKVLKDAEKNRYGYDASGLASIRANLSSVRSAAEIAYTKNSYGKKPFTLGPCKQMADTLFADKSLYSLISDATEGNPTKATCVATGSVGSVSAYAVSVPLPDTPQYSWCVDSTGDSVQIDGVINGARCR